MMGPLTRVELRRMAEAADRGRRPWRWKASMGEGSGGYPQQVIRDGDVVLICECYESPDSPASVAPYIAAFDPPTAITLLDDLDAADARIEVLREALDVALEGLAFSASALACGETHGVPLIRDYLARVKALRADAEAAK